ncbi:MAG TPA: GNAT family N-acetyltransferase [Solirubrobacteraceae bacterium]|nr:GNAT family N-acetyltransferase [Solirubrobacteraceae bacterium]
MVVSARQEDGSLLGLLPLALSSSGRLPTLRFAGATHADYLHPVCRRGDDERVASAAGRALVGIDDWSLVVLDNVTAGAGWWQTLGRDAGAVGLAGYRDSVLPAIEFAGADWNEYLAGRGRSFREQARRYPRRLERHHRVSYRRTTEESELERDMTTFFSLHDARWGTRGGSSLAGERARRFHLDFALSALRQGWLRLWFLEVDGAPAAAWYGWRIGSRYAYYQAGFDPRFSSLAVGFVLMVHTVRAALEEAASTYDMLLGDEPYKARFCNDSRDVRTVTLSRSRAGYLATAVEASLWKGSRLLPPRMRHLPRGIGQRLPSARTR